MNNWQKDQVKDELIRVIQKVLKSEEEKGNITINTSDSLPVLMAEQALNVILIQEDYHDTFLD